MEDEEATVTDTTTTKTAETEREEWVDVTSEVARGVRALEFTELLHDESFSLCDAMAAIELMDPKMDVSPVPVPKVAVLLEKQRLPGFPKKKTTTTGGAALKICDELLCREVAWADGSSRADTVDECAYCGSRLAFDALVAHFEATGDLGAGAVAACAALAVCTVDVSRSIVADADVYEEEDYHGSAAHSAGLGDFVDQAISLTGRVSEELLRKEEESSSSSLLRAHVALRSAYLEFLTLAYAPSFPAQNLAATLNAVADALDVLAAATTSEEEEQEEEDWQRCFLRGVEKEETTTVGARRRAAIATYGESVAGLRALVTLRAYLEDVVEEEKREALHVLTRVEALTLAVSRATRLVVPRSLAALEVGSEALRSPRPHDAVLGRGHRGVRLLDAVDDAIRCCSGGACRDEDDDDEEEYASFAAKACVVALQALRDLCLAPARLLPRLRENLLPDWSDAWLLADAADAAVAVRRGGGKRCFVLGTFVALRAFRYMALYLDLLVELDLCVDLTELEVVFFYAQFLHAAHLRLLEDAPRAVHRAEAAYVDARRGLARGLHLLTTALLRCPWEAQLRHLPFGSPRRRFDARFAPFDCLCRVVPRLSFDDFHRFTADARSLPRADLLDAASDQLLRTKTALNALLSNCSDDLLAQLGVDKTSLKALAKAAVANRLVAAKALMRLKEEEGSSSSSPGRRRRGTAAVRRDDDDDDDDRLRRREALRHRVDDLDRRFHPAVPVLRDPEAFS